MGDRLREVRSLRKDRWLYVASRKQHRNRTCKLTERVLKLDHLLFIQNISTFLIGSNPRLILHIQLALTTGVFHSIKTSDLKIRLLPVANGTAFSNISKTEDNLASYTQIFENFLRPEVFFPFNFAPRISRIFGWMARISEIQHLFREISVPFPAVPKFSKVLVEWKTPHNYLKDVGNNSPIPL